MSYALDSPLPTIRLRAAISAVVIAGSLALAGCLDWAIDSSRDTGADGDADADTDEVVCDDPVCDLWPQCGCRDGLGCVLDGEGRHSCAVVGSVGIGGECVSITECGYALTCLAPAGEPRTCRQFCRSDEDCPGNAICLIETGTETETWATTCTLECDPASTSPSCLPAVRCEIFTRDEPEMHFSHCMGTAGSGTAGASCTTDSSCARGHFCADAGGGVYRCFRFCTRPGGGQCTSPQVCAAFPEPVHLNAVEYGYCR